MRKRKGKQNFSFYSTRLFDPCLVEVWGTNISLYDGPVEGWVEMHEPLSLFLNEERVNRIRLGVPQTWCSDCSKYEHCWMLKEAQLSNDEDFEDDFCEEFVHMNKIKQVVYTGKRERK
jgi:hypothetical protein